MELNATNVELAYDDLGPCRVYRFYQPRVGLHATLVVDHLGFRIAGGGVRMLPDLTLAEVATLARAMTWKFAWLELPVAGAKAGIRYHPQAPDRDRVVQAFAEAVAPFVTSRQYLPGADMGTSYADVRRIRAAAGVDSEREPLGQRRQDGLALEELVTGYGVVQAAAEAAEALGWELRGAAVGLEGFGKVGAGCALALRDEGARLVAVSTLVGARYDPAGLDTDELLRLRERFGDAAVTEYQGGELLLPQALYTLPVDVLIPGARTHCIGADTARSVEAKLIVPAANAPLTPEAETVLARRGRTTVPDFIANAGGVLLEVVDSTGGGAKDVFRTVRDRVRANTRRVLDESRHRGEPPPHVAVAIARAWLRDRGVAI